MKAADRKEMKRARAAEFLLNVFGQRRNITKYHRYQQVGHRGIVHPCD